MPKQLTKADRDAFTAAAVAVLAAKERMELATQQGPSDAGSLRAGASEAVQRLVQVMAGLLKKGIAGVQFRGLLYLPVGMGGKLDTLWVAHQDQIANIDES